MPSSKNDSPATIDFSMLLASSVHDIKNSLGMLLSSLDEVIDVTTEDKPEQRKNYSILRSEASRINNALIYLLGLYRLQSDQLSIKLEEIYVCDFLEEQVASQQLLFDLNNIAVSVECDDNLIGFFDENLIAGVINNILVNGAKYTGDSIIIRAWEHQQALQISINDNGQGYPQDLLDTVSNKDRGIDFTSGSTNLGLFFSKEIAALHRSRGEQGSITLNNSELGGCFTLSLP